MKISTTFEVPYVNFDWKRPFLQPVLWVTIIALCGCLFGSIAADEGQVEEPDVATPPAVLDQPEAQVESHQMVAPQQQVVGEEKIYLPMIVTSAACTMNSEELTIVNNAINHAGQGRITMQCDPTLAQVARAKAQDMAERDYFGHTDPDGVGPNYKVRTAGYLLPSWYGNAINSNNIESIAAGYTTPESVWTGWMNSAGHRQHILGQSSFYADQINYGVGYYYDPNSDYRHYWVFISAPAE